MCCKHKRCEVDDSLGNKFCVECGEIRCSQASRYGIQAFNHNPQLFTHDPKPRKPKPSASKASPRCEVLEKKTYRMALWTLARIRGVPFYHTYTDLELRLILKIEPPDKRSYSCKELKEIAKSQGLTHNIKKTELIKKLGIDPCREVSNENVSMLKSFEYVFRER